MVLLHAHRTRDPSPLRPCLAARIILVTIIAAAFPSETILATGRRLAAVVRKMSKLVLAVAMDLALV
jgi:hypothetical protein